jgi:hypothetical protein
LTSYEPIVLIQKLVTFGKFIEDDAPKAQDEHLQKIIKQYLKISEKQTTDVSRREERGAKFVEAIESLP